MPTAENEANVGATPDFRPRLTMDLAPRLTMDLHRSLIDELESSIAHKDILHRASVLRRVTDLFAAKSQELTGEQLALFDDVMGRLIKEIDATARVAFGERIIGIGSAPPGVVRALALDDAIEVAGPILAGFEPIADDTLIESANTKGQDHLLAISRRASLSEAVTDVLVDRGGQQVVISTAENQGARFSEFGYITVVKRAVGDRDLAVRVWLRSDIPRQHLLALFEGASASVQRELEAIDHSKVNEIRDMILRAKDELQTQVREHFPKYFAAHSYVQGLRDLGGLSESQLLAFAMDEKFDEVSIALSLLCDVPVGLIERALTHEHFDQLLVLAKAISLSWDTVAAILSMRAEWSAKQGQGLREALMSFNKLKPETARRAVQYYRLRQRMVAS